MTDAERTAAHEAGHACACVVLGVPVRLLDTVHRTEPTPGGGLRAIYGEVRHALEQVTSRDDAHKRMIIILCGQIEGADEWEDLPQWPLNPGASTDEHNLHALADCLGLDERGYSEVKFEALKLTLDPFYESLHVAVTGMLGYFPHIGPEMIGRLVGLARAELMDRVLKASVTTTDEGTFSAGDLNRGRGQGKRPRDPWRMMSELLAAERVATKSVPPPVQVASFEC